MGLDRERLTKLEQAMLTAFEAHHRVRVVEQYERPTKPPPAVADAPNAQGHSPQLETRVRDLEEELRRAQSSINVEIDLGRSLKRVKKLRQPT